MALRGMSGAYSTTSVSTFSITYAGANAIEVGDLLILVSGNNAGGTSPVTTEASGFTSGSSIGLSDIVIDSGTDLHIAVKIATAADVGTPTYTTDWQNPGYIAQQIRAYSGRVNSSIAAAFGNVASTAATSSHSTTPWTFNQTGITALGGDDIVAVTAENIYTSGSSGTTYGASISGFSDGLVTYDSAPVHPPIIAGLDKPNASAGATGTLPVALSSSGSVQTDAAGFTLSLPAASAPSGPKPGGFFFENYVPKPIDLALGPLAWIVKRRNERRRA